MTKWFTEEEAAGVRYSYAVNEEILSDKSSFQDIKVVETKAYGRMLALDNCVMLTDTDEFVYHEMISHIPVCYHRKPERVLVIGGGDGGTVRELLKHSEIKHITLCEIDGQVISICQKYFPKVAGYLDDPRVEVIVGDGVGYCQRQEAAYDLVLVDSADPIGPGEGLFTGAFYQSVAKALKPGGIMVAQTESPWWSAEVLKRIAENIASGFALLRPYVGPIPTYPRGLWSWTLAAQSERDIASFYAGRIAAIADSLQYLSPAIARNVFEIPPFYRRKLGL